MGLGYRKWGDILSGWMSYPKGSGIATENFTPQKPPRAFQLIDKKLLTYGFRISQVGGYSLGWVSYPKGSGIATEILPPKKPTFDHFNLSIKNY